MGAVDTEGLDALCDTGALDILKEGGQLHRFNDIVDLWRHVFKIGTSTSAQSPEIGHSGNADSWDGGSISESHVSSSGNAEEDEEEPGHNPDQDESFKQFERECC